MSRRWPACTPSKLPMVTATGREEAVGESGLITRKVRAPGETGQFGSRSTVRPSIVRAMTPAPDPANLLDPIRAGRPLLLVVAAASEARSVVEGVTGSRPDSLRIRWSPEELNGRVSLLLTGVGKANAAGAVGHALANKEFGAIVSIGVGGALPTDESVEAFHHAPGDVVCCARSVFADEGVISGSGWETMADRGFGPRIDLPESDSMAVDRQPHARTARRAVPGPRSRGDCLDVLGDGGSRMEHRFAERLHGRGDGRRGGWTIRAARCARDPVPRTARDQQSHRR